MIKKFCDTFNYKLEGEIMEISNKYYLINPLLKEVISKNREKPRSAGVFLGEIKRKEFIPSIPLLKMINKETDRFIVVDKKAAWLFICGRDLMEQSVIKSSINKGLAIVQDEDKDFLGLARIENGKDIFAKNVLDIGNYLRREK